jgi:hypothetical protein
LAVDDDAGVQLLLGNGDGTFQPARTVAAGTFDSFVAGDFTGDGHLDLAVDDGEGVQLLLGNGDGTFQPARRFAPWLFGSMVAGDFNGDGRLDIAIVPLDSNDVSVLLGNGDGTFQPQVISPVGLSLIYGEMSPGMVAGEFTGNGRLDLAVSDDDGIQMLVGNGDGTFQPARTVAAGIKGAIVAGNFTRSGHLDLAVANSGDNTVSVLLGNGDGTFQPQVPYTVGASSSSIVVGDFTGDGHLDIATDVSLLLGNGDGTFQTQVKYPVGMSDLVAGDFNGDGAAARQRRRYVPDPGQVPRGDVGPRGGGLQRRRSLRPRRGQRDQRAVGAAEQRRWHVPIPVRRRGGRYLPGRRVSL